MPKKNKFSIVPRPAAHDTGFPPKELKNSTPLSNDLEISSVVITAPIGCPLPIGLPNITKAHIRRYIN